MVCMDVDMMVREINSCYFANDVQIKLMNFTEALRFKHWDSEIVDKDRNIGACAISPDSL